MNFDHFQISEVGDTAIMASLDPSSSVSPPPSSSQPLASTTSSSLSSLLPTSSLPDVLVNNELQSLNLHASSQDEENGLSFLLLNDKEEFLVESDEFFARKLGCNKDHPCKVLSIIGNTGEGKSYSLNHALFDGREVFSTSSSQDSCTIGVWAALEPKLNLIVLDTEGLLGSGMAAAATSENQRVRQLLKIMAVSDVVVYKIRAERLHNDLLYFLGDASKAYNEYFSNELYYDKQFSLLGPSVIIFHETRYTEVLQRDRKSSPEDIIRQRLSALSQDVSAFSGLHYLGFQDSTNLLQEDPNESFKKLRDLISDDVSLRSPRSVSLIYKTFMALNAKFNGELSSSHRSFPDEYFTCQSKCSSCYNRCTRPLNHTGQHKTDVNCVYQKKFENKNYLCLSCYRKGRRVVVVPKASSSQEGTWLGLATYAWSGFVLECSTCGVIYRSRQHWYGNQTPETLTVVQTEVSHVWPGERTLQGTHNAARRLLDGLSHITETVSSLSAAASTKTMTNWVTDQIAPDYWRPNCDISNCFSCDKKLVSSSGTTADGGGSGGSSSSGIHHCRKCGEGFCESCSDYKRPCPERGWGSEHVRVCKSCFLSPISEPSLEIDSGVQVRQVGEKVVGTLSSLTSVVLEYPMTILKDSARPDYWIPDDECVECSNCSRPFSKNNSETTNSSSSGCSSNSQISGKVHHCRQCGHGVCDDCSKNRAPVPHRGWDQPVRVCDKCLTEQHLKAL